MAEEYGVLKIQAERSGLKTVIRDQFFNGVLKTTRPVYQKTTPLMYMIHVGGGYVKGDRYETAVRLDEGSTLALTTQASTKVYKTPGGKASQSFQAELGPDSCLLLRQDPLIVYEDGCYHQKIQFDMAETAHLLYSDIVTPGWSGDERLFPYEEIRSDVSVFINGRLAVKDRFLFQPGSSPLSAPLLMEEHTHMGTLLLVSPQITADFIEVLQRELGESDEVKIGVSQLPVSGFCVRALAGDSGSIEDLFAEVEKRLHGEFPRFPLMRWRK
ncbi:urease accessory protein UreD [Jeotgalibacillus sp. S-D1]|uniref:urease accessory protein UreD n=1 Tax=Jeotgalibacillus sp. S-D1 TaxID=2552189 RepID=UPI00105947F7|nr:urease accessory protein UreD [Jeotgalibacillus sp. S-D1]TDL32657.1 urease accessory protein UreD [Jeotgalibacillus sp. S-D1]